MLNMLILTCDIIVKHPKNKTICTKQQNEILNNSIPYDTAVKRHASF